MSKWYGSLENRLMENQKDIPEIVEGMGVTEYLYSDRHAYEVTKVVNQKDVFIRRYDVRNKGGCYGCDDWELISNPDGYEMEVVYRYGNWYQKYFDKFENKKKKKKIKLRFGVADYYYDWTL